MQKSSAWIKTSTLLGISIMWHSLYSLFRTSYSVRMESRFVRVLVFKSGHEALYAQLLEPEVLWIRAGCL